MHGAKDAYLSRGGMREELAGVHPLRSISASVPPVERTADGYGEEHHCARQAISNPPARRHVHYGAESDAQKDHRPGRVVTEDHTYLRKVFGRVQGYQNTAKFQPLGRVRRVTQGSIKCG